MNTVTYRGVHIETAVRLRKVGTTSYYMDYTTTARPLFPSLPGLQGLGEAIAYHVVESLIFVAVVVIIFDDNSLVLQRVLPK